MAKPSVDERLAALRARRQPDLTDEVEATSSFPYGDRFEPPIDLGFEQFGPRDQADLSDEFEVLAPLPNRGATDSSIERRLAALHERRLESTSTRPFEPASVDAYEPLVPSGQILTNTAPVIALAPDLYPDELYRRSWWPERLTMRWSGSRTVAAGTSVVSFASMVVAMGPILQSVDSSGAEADNSTGVNVEAGEANPEAPSVQIEINGSDRGLPPSSPGLPAHSSGEVLDPVQGEVGEPAAEVTETTTETATDGPGSTTPATAPPSMAAPTTAAPTDGPTTAALSTAAPTTASPSTVAPTTAPPTTKRPKSDGSG